MNIWEELAKSLAQLEVAAEKLKEAAETIKRAEKQTAANTIKMRDIAENMRNLRKQMMVNNERFKKVDSSPEPVSSDNVWYSNGDDTLH